MRKWWNWQTHHLEGVAPKGVGVQVPPSAPRFPSNLFEDPGLTKPGVVFRFGYNNPYKANVVPSYTIKAGPVEVDPLGRKLEAYVPVES